MTLPNRAAAGLAGWSDERVELMKKLWANGQSASQIAKELGGVTRNAVIGKVTRLGLTGRATPATPPVKRYTAPPVKRAPYQNSGLNFPKPKPDLRLAGNNMVFEAAPVTPLPKSGAFRALPGSTPLTIEELEPRHCKWPIDSDDGVTRFCCRQAPDTGVYCPTHEAASRSPRQPSDRTGPKMARSLRRYI